MGVPNTQHMTNFATHAATRRVANVIEDIDKISFDTSDRLLSYYFGPCYAFLLCILDLYLLRVVSDFEVMMLARAAAKL